MIDGLPARFGQYSRGVRVPRLQVDMEVRNSVAVDMAVHMLRVLGRTKGSGEVVHQHADGRRFGRGELADASHMPFRVHKQVTEVRVAAVSAGWNVTREDEVVFVDHATTQRIAAGMLVADEAVGYHSPIIGHPEADTLVRPF